MFNIRVFKVKDLIKYFIELIIVILIIFVITKALSKNNKEKLKESFQGETKEWGLDYDLTSCIDVSSGIVKSINSNESTQIKAYQSDFFEDILKSQIGSAEDFAEIESDENVTEENKKSNNEKNENTQSSNIELAKTRVKYRSYNK